MTYAGDVSSESVKIELTLDALNDLDVKMADIENAYLAAPITEKVLTALDPELTDDAGKRELIVIALFGLKSSGAAFRISFLTDRTHTCMCQRENGQAIFADLKLLGTTAGISQTSAMLVILYEYDRVVGAYVMCI
jgi:hypothetical protein